MPETFDPYHEWLGIAATGQPPDHYRLLGIERFEDDPDTIQAAADRQTAYVRAFLAGERAHDAQRLLAELTAALACLLQSADKAAYDAALRSQPSGATAPDRTMARPTPRSASESPRDTPPAASTGPAPPAPGPPLPGATGQAASWGTPAAYPQAPPAYAGLPQQPVPPGLPPGYSAGVPPPSVPGMGPPPGPPAVAEPPRAPEVPVVHTGDASGRPPGRAVRDSRESSGQEKLWLLVAVAGVVVVGAALVVALIAARPASEQPDDTDPQQMAPLLGKLVIQQPDGTIHFTASDAVIHGTTARLDTIAGQRVVSHWTSPDDWLSWDFRVEQPAVFRVELTYAAPPAAGGKFSVAIGETSRRANVRPTGDADTYATHEVGFLTVRRSGRHRLDLRVVTKPAGPLMILKAVHLTPRDVGYVE